MGINFRGDVAKPDVLGVDFLEFGHGQLRLVTLLEANAQFVNYFLFQLIVRSMFIFGVGKQGDSKVVQPTITKTTSQTQQ